jgi:hypothetical protein
MRVPTESPSGSAGIADPPLCTSLPATQQQYILGLTVFSLVQ